MSSDDSFAFTDDGAEVIEITEKQHRALNKSFTLVHSGQKDLEGAVVYEDVREANVSFSPTHHVLNKANLSTAVYPTNMSVRKYQDSIVKHALYENLLCALPTGLGKTLIASTVMLNFYRWVSGEENPESGAAGGKIIFMAPTRPLVAQQMRACYGITGIPLEHTAVLLDLQKKQRKRLWDERRVFFSTPQTVQNDLASGVVDPSDICCVVVDEAHRAKGNYASAKVVEFITRFNTSFRVLALTATPGAEPEAIQGIVDSLSLSAVEVRTEDDSDVKQYMNSREIEKVDCAMTAEIERCLQYICAAVLPVLKKANHAGIYRVTDPAQINSFGPIQQQHVVMGMRGLAEGIKWTYWFQLKLLAEVGQMLRRLNIYGLQSFYSYFLDKYTEFTTKYDMKKSTNKVAAGFYYNAGIKKMKNFLEKHITGEDRRALSDPKVVKGVYSHPKLKELVSRILEFLQERSGSDSSIIVFTEFRESALEIVQCLESANKIASKANLIRPHIFIGQSSEKTKFDEDEYKEQNKKGGKGKKKKKAAEEPPTKKRKVVASNTGNARIDSSVDAQMKGMSQKQQKELLEKFKQSVYNVLVATSIGEEGLDIGEVDMIVCFDSTSSPIKNIQRMGRTGRKRAGKVVLLFSGNERKKFDKAMDNYQWIQNQIRTNKAGIKFHPSDRILPPDCKPEMVYKKIEIPAENKEVSGEKSDETLLKAVKLTQRAGPGKTKGKGKKVAKGQAKLDKRFFMPKNVETGFVSASSLVRKVGGSELSKKMETEYSKDDATFEMEDAESKNDLDLDVLFSSSPKQHSSVVIDLDEFSDDELDENLIVPTSTQKVKQKAAVPVKVDDVPLEVIEEDCDSPERPSQGERGNMEVVDTPLPVEQKEDVKTGSTVKEDILPPGFIVDEESVPDSSEVPFIPSSECFNQLFSGRDGFMTSQKENEFYRRSFPTGEPPQWDTKKFNVIDNPLLCIENGGAAYGHLAHSSKSESLISYYKHLHRT